MMAVMAVWAAVLIAYGVTTGIAMVSSNPSSGRVHDLDMAPNSVDDMYDGCKDKMQTKVEKEYLPNEKNKDSDFKKAWLDAEKEYDEKIKKTKLELGKEQFVAVYAYTAKETNLYKNLNGETRTQKSEYKTTFKYHALHFFLTDAIQTLNAEKKCYDTYRGVGSSFKDVVLNTEIRFGSFTSSSKNYDAAKKFGTKSCFKIHTCHGADIMQFSEYETEAEVLIPPYEVFKVTDIKKKSEQKDLECDVVYKVEHARTHSNLNCDLSPK